MSETHAKTLIGTKNPTIAAAASFFIPGLGQIYSGEARKGIGFIIIATIFASLWLFLIKEKQLEMGGAILAASGACILFWIENIFDAYKTTKNMICTKK